MRKSIKNTLDILFFMTLLFAGSTFNFAQDVCPVKVLNVKTIKGQIVSAGQINPPVSNTKIELYKIGNPDVLISSSVTDKNGFFEITNVSKGEYRLAVHFILDGKIVAPKYDSLILKVTKPNSKKDNKLIYIKLGMDCFETEVTIQKRDGQ